MDWFGISAVALCQERAPDSVLPQITDNSLVCTLCACAARVFSECKLTEVLYYGRWNCPYAQVMAMAHYPVFCTGCNGNSDVSGEYYSSADAEVYGNCNASASRVYGERRKAAHGSAPKSVRGASDTLVADMQPILASFGVDFFMAGHWHYYESLYPGVKGTSECLSCLQPTQKNFVNPRGTIHVTTGNGGPPGKDSFTGKDIHE